MSANQILVVDDEVGIRELLFEILRDEGYGVRLAENAQTARSARKEMRPDLVRQPAGDLAPGRVALRLDKVRDVVEDDDETLLAARAQAGAPDEERALAIGAAVLHLLLPLACP